MDGNPLMNVPGLAGYLAQQQMGKQNRQQDITEQANQLKLVDMIKTRQQEEQDAQQLKGVMTQTGGDPTKAIQALMTAGTPKSIELASKLKVLVPKEEIKAPHTRTYQQGEKSVTEELQPDGTWKMIGSGPKFSKSVINVNSGIESGGATYEPDVIDFYATQALTSGDQSWRSGLSRSKEGVKLIVEVDKRIPKLAKEVGMTPVEASNSKQMFAARLKAIKDFSTGTQGQMVTSFNTAIDHLDTMKNLGEALKNNDIQLANKIKNTAAEWTGDADVTNLDTAKQIVGAEIVKSIVARGGGVAEREEAADRISRISSPAQLAGYIDTTQKLMAGQLKSLEKQYETTTSRKDFREKLLPKSKLVLEKLSKPELTEQPTSANPSAYDADKEARYQAWKAQQGK